MWPLIIKKWKEKKKKYIYIYIYIYMCVYFFKKKISDTPILTELIKFLHAYCNAEIQNKSKYSKRSTCHKISRIQKIIT
jgi:hypothetical protein